MPNKRAVFIVGGNGQYRSMFTERGWYITTSIYNADLVQFTGGEDVSPSLYGEPPHPRTFFNPDRDEKEQKIFNQARELGIPMAGICRGGQFLNVMNGGSMWQDVDNHTGAHLARVNGYIGDVYVSSTHHQMMRPSKTNDHIVLMAANLSRKKECMMDAGHPTVVSRIIGSHNKEDDVESVFYPDTRTLCFQPHPEFNGIPMCRDVYFHFIENYLMGNVTYEEAANHISSTHINKVDVRSILTKSSKEEIAKSWKEQA